jgi:succinoglycan biosynthesis protein ExoO
MVEKTDVSVVIACHNTASTLGAAIDSVLNQTFPAKEILIGDDASTDNIHFILNAFQNAPIPIRYFYSKENIGPASMRNRLLDLATGSWIAILDGDDVFEPKRIETLLDISSNADIISDDLIFWIDGHIKKGSVCKRHRFFPSDPCQIGLTEMIAHDLGLLKPIFRKDFLLKNRLSYTEGMFHTEDLDLYVRSLLAGAKWRHTTKALYLYRKHAHSLSRKWTEGLADSYHALEHLQLEPGIRDNPLLMEMLEHRKVIKKDLEIVYEIRDLFRDRKYLSAARKSLRFRAIISSSRLLKEIL